MVILDGKRNDIGSTATAYAQGFLGRQSPWGADALTVSPYLGDDSLQPFVDVAVAAGGGRLRAGEDLEPRRADVPGPRLRRPAALPPRGRLCRAAGRPDGRGSAAMGRWGPWWGPPIRPSWPSCVPPCRTPGSWCPASAPKGERRPTWLAAFDGRGCGAIVNNSRGIIFAYTLAPVCRAVWSDAVARGRRGRHPRHDRPASRGHARRQACTVISGLVGLASLDPPYGSPPAATGSR